MPTTHRRCCSGFLWHYCSMPALGRRRSGCRHRMRSAKIDADTGRILRDGSVSRLTAAADLEYQGRQHDPETARYVRRNGGLPQFRFAAVLPTRWAGSIDVYTQQAVDLAGYGVRPTSRKAAEGKWSPRTGTPPIRASMPMRSITRRRASSRSVTSFRSRRCASATPSPKNRFGNAHAGAESEPHVRRPLVLLVGKDSARTLLPLCLQFHPLLQATFLKQANSMKN